MRISGVSVVAAALLVGCGPHSQIDPKASVTLAGSVQSDSGGAPPTTTVKLIRHPDALQALGQVFVTIGSLGLACIGGQVDICSSFEESPTDAGGAYTFAMRGADTQGSFGQALTFTAFASCGAQTGNCAVASDFAIQKTKLTIPAMRFWTATGMLAADGMGNGLPSWPALESGVGGGAADDYKISISTTTGALLWLQDAETATSASIDRHVTQDFDGSWTVIATRKQSADGTDFKMQWYAPQQPYANRNLTPLSRAADCFTQGADGNPVMLARPCPLTDGNMTTKFVPVSPPPCPSGQMCQSQPVNNWMMIDLGFSHPIAEIVLYDVSTSSPTSPIVIETSDDMMVWTPQGTVQPTPYQTRALTGAARFVRLRITDPSASFYGGANGEVAVFAPF